jgi:2-polyprenyl-3-methyl-5-hydroxy-6-metoxy-1,4-benzoquinol methylase
MKTTQKTSTTSELRNQGLIDLDIESADPQRDTRQPWSARQSTRTDASSVRQPEQTLAELESLAGLLAELETSLQPGAARLNDIATIPEHPEVTAISPIAVETLPCLVCGQTSAIQRFAIEGISEKLVTCQGCELGSLFPMPSGHRIASFYPAEYYGTPNAKFEPIVERVVRLGARSRVKSLVRGLPKGSRVLDVGCGRGVMVRALLDLGYETHGVEISEAAAAAVDTRAEVRIAGDLSEANYESQSFDAVVLWHVLEHLRNPEETLAEIRRILRPGGRLILAVPNFASWQSRWSQNDWFHLDLPRHLYHFSPSTLTQLVNRMGFQCRSTKHFALLQNPFGWLQSWLNKNSQTPRNSLYSLLHRRGEHEDLNRISRSKQRLMRAAYYLGLPIAGVVSVAAAASKQGGTIAMVADLPKLITTPLPTTSETPSAIAFA